MTGIKNKTGRHKKFKLNSPLLWDICSETCLGHGQQNLLDISPGSPRMSFLHIYPVRMKEQKQFHNLCHLEYSFNSLSRCNWRNLRELWSNKKDFAHFYHHEFRNVSIHVTCYIILLCTESQEV